MKKVFVLFGAVALVLTACDKDDNDNTNMGMTTKNQTDVNFMTGVAMSNTAEVSLGQLALSKGTNQAVRNYGQMMVTHHSMAQSMLKALGDSVQQRVPDSLSMDMQMTAQRLNGLSGYSFDTAYLNSQVMGHQKTLSIFQNQISAGQNTWIKNFASRNVGTIQQHYNMADSIRKTM